MEAGIIWVAVHYKNDRKVIIQVRKVCCNKPETRVTAATTKHPGWKRFGDFLKITIISICNLTIIVRPRKPNLAKQSSCVCLE